MNQPAVDAANRDPEGRARLSPTLASLVVILLTSCGFARIASAVKAEDPDSPEAIVSAFYEICIEEKVTGLPTEAQFEELGPLLSESLHSLLADARMEQAEFSRENPYEKPPWVEGDLFSSLFEGPTRFTAEKAVIEGKRATVTVSFVDDSPGNEKPFTWKDDVMLVRNSDGSWRIDDVVYRGNWDFASKGKLSDALSPGESSDEEE